jgi:hypothetical protein
MDQSNEQQNQDGTWGQSSNNSNQGQPQQGGGQFPQQQGGQWQQPNYNNQWQQPQGSNQFGEQGNNQQWQQQPQSVFNNPSNFNMGMQSLPNATASLVLGILALACGGILFGIIGLVLANKDIKLYNNNPGMYSESSFKNTKIGRVCSIIGLVLWSLFLILYVIGIVYLVNRGYTGNRYNSFD